AVVTEATVELLVVLDVTRRLLEVRHESAPLEDLGEEVRRLLAGEVHTTELRDGVVAVLEEHAVVELFGATQADRGIHGEVAGEVEVVHELVEEEATQARVRARVPREERALHDLGQVDEREHRAVEVGEVRPEDGRFLLGEILGGVHAHSLASSAPAGRPGWRWYRRDPRPTRTCSGPALPEPQMTRTKAPGTMLTVTSAAGGAGTP